MNHFAKKVLLIAAGLAVYTLPGTAFAKTQHLDNAAGDFADSKTVSDKDLSTMRGGFVDVNGLIIQDFSFMQAVRVDGELPSSISITQADLENSFAGGGGNLIPPIIIQNMNNDKVIAMAQQLNITASNVGPVLANAAAMHQADLMGSLAAIH